MRFKRMQTYITLDKALELIKSNRQILDSEIILIQNALDRICAENIASPHDIPHSNKSAMDGYAVNYKDIDKSITKFKVIGSIEAGSIDILKPGLGEAVKIMTGATVPNGEISVIMKEKAEELESGYIQITHTPKPFENIVIKGEDIRKEEILIKKNTRLKESHLSLLATTGITRIKVYKQPSIGIISTGSELVDIDAPAQSHQIRNSNSILLQNLLKRDGYKSANLGIIKDNETELRQNINKYLEKYDMLISTGGVSAGDKDLILKVASQAEVHGIFHQVMIRPGRPVFFARKNNSVTSACPGIRSLRIYAIFFLLKPIFLRIRPTFSTQN
ncbi:MAG: molybdopterin molybdotransferase MoeA [Planctomycetes bacterium]|nr:molybdopterin molybdotransferase MoeA [Planctomycetota bacterium]